MGGAKPRGVANPMDGAGPQGGGGSMGGDPMGSVEPMGGGSAMGVGDATGCGDAVGCSDAVGGAVPSHDGAELTGGDPPRGSDPMFGRVPAGAATPWADARSTCEFIWVVARSGVGYQCVGVIPPTVLFARVICSGAPPRRLHAREFREWLGPTMAVRVVERLAAAGGLVEEETGTVWPWLSWTCGGGTFDAPDGGWHHGMVWPTCLRTLVNV